MWMPLPWNLSPPPTSGSPGDGHEEVCPRSQDDSVAAGHVANRETESGKETELVPASQSQQHTEDRQNHTLHHPCSGRPLGRGCIQCGQLQLGKCLGRVGAAWDRIRVSLRSESARQVRVVWGCPLPMSRGLVFVDVPPSVGDGWPHPGSWTHLQVQRQLHGPQPLDYQELLWHVPVAHNSASAHLMTTPSGCGGWRVLASQMGDMGTEPTADARNPVGLFQHPPTQARRTVWKTARLSLPQSSQE